MVDEVVEVVDEVVELVVVEVLGVVVVVVDVLVDVVVGGVVDVVVVPPWGTHTEGSGSGWPTSSAMTTERPCASVNSAPTNTGLLGMAFSETEIGFCPPCSTSSTPGVPVNLQTNHFGFGGGLPCGSWALTVAAQPVRTVATQTANHLPLTPEPPRHTALRLHQPRYNALPRPWARMSTALNDWCSPR